MSCSPSFDKKAGEVFADDFLEKVKESKHKEMVQLCSDQFFEYTPKQELFEILKDEDTKLGKLESSRLRHCGEFVTNDTFYTYVYTYECKFEKDSAIVKITLLNEAPSDSIKVFGYHIRASVLSNKIHYSTENGFQIY
jgi:hypothetical protein